MKERNIVLILKNSGKHIRIRWVNHTLSGVEVLLQAIEIQKDSEKWQKGYIPNPSTWLNQGRWEDEIGKQDNNRGYAERLFGPRHEKD